MGRKARRTVYDPSIMDRVDINSERSSFVVSQDPLESPPPAPSLSAGRGLTVGEDYYDNDYDDYDAGNGNGNSIYSVPPVVEMDEHQEILDPRLHKIQQGKRADKCRRRCLISILLAGLLAIIVTASVIGARNRQRAAGGDGGDSTSSSARAVYLPPPDSDLPLHCAQSINNQDALLKCEEGCEKAECCQREYILSLADHCVALGPQSVTADGMC